MLTTVLFLFAGMITTFAGSQVIDQASEYLEVFLLKTTPRVRGHNEGIGRMMYSFYRTNRAAWHLAGIGLVAVGWIMVLIGYHFGLVVVVQVDPSLINWYWPALMFAIALGILVVISNVREVKKISRLNESLSKGETEETGSN